MQGELKLTPQLLRVLRVFMDARDYRASGAELMKSTKLPSGTIYPMLGRMETAGWVRAEWEQIDPAEAGRPRRRFYFLTGVGQRAATTPLADFSAMAWVTP